jgi:hypothetical protein
MKKIKAWGLEKDGKLLFWDNTYISVLLYPSSGLAEIQLEEGERVVPVEVTVEKIPARRRG